MLGASEVTKSKAKVADEENWDRFYGELLAFARSRAGSKAEADDIVQDAFLRAQKQAQSGKKVDNPRAWLFQVVRHLVADSYRHGERKRAISSRAEEIQKVEQQLTPETLQGEVFPLVARVLPLFIDSLPHPYKEALQLVDLGEHSVAEAAEQAGVTLACMKARVHRGRQQLLGALRECCAFEVDGRGRIVDWERRQPGSCACSG